MHAGAPRSAVCLLASESLLPQAAARWKTRLPHPVTRTRPQQRRLRQSRSSRPAGGGGPCERCWRSSVSCRGAPRASRPRCRRCCRRWRSAMVIPRATAGRAPMPAGVLGDAAELVMRNCWVSFEGFLLLLVSTGLRTAECLRLRHSPKVDLGRLRARFLKVSMPTRARTGCCPAILHRLHQHGGRPFFHLLAPSADSRGVGWPPRLIWRLRWRSKHSRVSRPRRRRCGVRRRRRE